jgi:hypothetical protein
MALFTFRSSSKSISGTAASHTYVEVKAPSESWEDLSKCRTQSVKSVRLFWKDLEPVVAKSWRRDAPARFPP